MSNPSDDLRYNGITKRYLKAGKMPQIWLYRYPCGMIGYFIGIDRIAVNSVAKHDKRCKFITCNSYRFSIGGWINV